MYEGNILSSAAESGERDAASGADGLRLLSWDELVARLGAARDFRRFSGMRIASGAGSFDCTSARHLVAQGEGKPGINPFALANGKIAHGIGLVDIGDDMSGDRGRQ